MANQDPDTKAAAAAVKEQQKAEAKAAAEEARKAKAAEKAEQDAARQGFNPDELADDINYQKALNEIGGLTLVPANKVDKNLTVERFSDAVYPDDMVIAKRL